MIFIVFEEDTLVQGTLIALEHLTPNSEILFVYIHNNPEIRLIAKDKFSVRTHFSHGIKNFNDIHDEAANLLRIFGFATCHDFFFVFTDKLYWEKPTNKKNR